MSCSFPNFSSNPLSPNTPSIIPPDPTFHLISSASARSFKYTNAHQVPATINRVATLIDPTYVSFGLNFTEALLLPLQGFFNALIYVAISTEACAFLRVHCKRVLRRIFIEPWKYCFPCLFRPKGRQPEVPPPPKLSAAGYPLPASCGQSQMDPGRPQPPRPTRPAPERQAARPARPARPVRHGRTGRPLVRSIQQDEIAEYHRLRRVLNISPDPESTAGNNSNK